MKDSQHTLQIRGNNPQPSTTRGLVNTVSISLSGGDAGRHSTKAFVLASRKFILKGMLPIHPQFVTRSSSDVDFHVECVGEGQEHHRAERWLFSPSD